MASNGIVGDTAQMIYEKIEAFADFGFAESHSISFALLVYASSWFKLHYPAMFLAALLRAQPMGFYSPQSLVADARRHGVEVRRPDLHLSNVHADLELVRPLHEHESATTGRAECLFDDADHISDPKPFDRDAPFDHTVHRRDTRFAVRLGLAEVRSIGKELAERIVATREADGPFADQADLVRRIGLTAVQMEALATAGAFDSFALSRREALWIAGSAAQERADQLETSLQPVQLPLLPELNPAEAVMADLWATGISPDDYPTRHVRDYLDARGVLPAARLATAENNRKVLVGGVVTHRQRPATAGGVTFMNLEDETGMINIVVPYTTWNHFRRIARDSPALLIRGRLERAEGVTNVIAEKFEQLHLNIRTMSRDFH
jgi:error-prone DNA polymerase